MLINKSVLGSKIHRSLLKNILWKTTKYFEKSEDTTIAISTDTAKNNVVPIQTIRGKTCPIFTLISKNKRITIIISSIQPWRMARAPKNSPLTSSMWEISRSLKNSLACPFTIAGTWRSSRFPRRYAIISRVTSRRSSISMPTTSVT